jgi:hypothetical protein
MWQSAAQSPGSKSAQTLLGFCSPAGHADTAKLDGPAAARSDTALRKTFEWSELNIYDLAGPTGRHGVLLGTKRWRR